MNEVITNSHGERLDYTFLAGNEHHKKKGWIILLGHGVTGNKDRPVIADTAKALSAAGFDSIHFSFSGNGSSEGDFRESTITKEVGDLSVVIDVVSSAYTHIAYIGHSMGSAVGVIQASQDPRIQLLVSLAGMVDCKVFAETEFGNETPDEGLMWEEEDCPLSSQFMNDLCMTIGSVLPCAEKVRVPWLLLHGTADDVVLPKDTKAIESLKGSAVDVVFIEGADHSFNEAEHKAEMTRTVVDWFTKKTI